MSEFESPANRRSSPYGVGIVGQEPRHCLSIGFQKMLVNTLSPRVLLVEDTPELALWVGAALRQAGMEVSFAQDGWQAQSQLMAQHGFDVVVLDVQIPGPDGLTVLEQLRQAGDEIGRAHV